MRLFRFFRVVGFLSFIGFGGIPSSATPLTLNSGDESFSISNDFFSTSFNLAASPKIALGNFDGQGGDDVAIFLPQTTESGEVVLLLNPAPGQLSFSRARTLRIAVPSNVKQLKMLDLNGDGRKDLAFDNEGRVDIVFGKELPPSSLNLVTEMPDLRVTGPSFSVGTSLCAGDFTGDVTEDLFVGYDGGGCLIVGNKALLVGHVEISSGGAIPCISGVGLGWESAKGDFNGDGKDDLALSNPLTGTIDIFQGAPSFPSLWSIDSASASVRVTGWPRVGILSGTVAVGSGDLNADGKQELLAGRAGPNSTPIERVRELVAIDGAELSIPNTIKNIQLSNPVGVYALSPYSGGLVDLQGVRVMDFDGDGANDFIFSSVTTVPDFQVMCLLSSQVGVGLDRFEDTGVENLSFLWDGDFDTLASGTFGTDSPRDLVVYESYSSGPPYGALRFLHGFQPLLNPSLRIRERTPARPRVTLELYVEGAPTEVALTGDVADDFRDRWLPYKSSLPVDLTSNEGKKVVHIVFRNAVGRQSVMATDEVSLGVGTPETETFTNVLGRGSPGRVDCHLISPGHVKAEIFGRGGKFILCVMDRDLGPGVWPIVWDGTNAAGEVVSPGMYVLVVTVNGHSEIHKIIVQG